MTTSLHDHLFQEHCRTREDIDTLPPAAALHRFEHVEQSMGLLDLAHHHASDGTIHRSRAASQVSGT